MKGKAPTLVFVDGAYHRQGIDRALYGNAEALNGGGFFGLSKNLRLYSYRPALPN